MFFARRRRDAAETGEYAAGANAAPDGTARAA
jgi:hypothetical protein